MALWRAQNVTAREIARRLGGSPSTISRELRRNASTRTYRLDYKASTAQWHAERRARRPKVAKLVGNDRLRFYVRTDWPARSAPKTARASARQVRTGKVETSRIGAIDDGWRRGAPEQIANRLPTEFPDDESMRISHEAIYQALYVQARGALNRQLVACVRTGRALRVRGARARQRAWAHVTPEERDRRAGVEQPTGDRPLRSGSRCLVDPAEAAGSKLGDPVTGGTPPRSNRECPPRKGPPLR